MSRFVDKVHYTEAKQTFHAVMDATYLRHDVLRKASLQNINMVKKFIPDWHKKVSDEFALITNLIINFPTKEIDIKTQIVVSTY